MDCETYIILTKMHILYIYLIHFWSIRKCPLAMSHLLQIVSKTRPHTAHVLFFSLPLPLINQPGIITKRSALVDCGSIEPKPIYRLTIIPRRNSPLYAVFRIFQRVFNSVKCFKFFQDEEFSTTNQSRVFLFSLYASLNKKDHKKS